MITNLPTSTDYYTSGKELFNFAWETTASLLVEIDESYCGDDEQLKSEISEAYWAAAKRTLTTALTVMQQGVELIIKGRIAEVSPYLLISDAPSQWPSPYSGPIDFERFRTIDAQDLIRVHDTFSETKFGAKFVEKFHDLRVQRNTVLHSAAKSVSVTVAEVIDSVLYMHKSLFPDESWFKVRREFLRNAPSAQLGSDEFVTNRTCWEASFALKLLGRSQVESYLRVDKKQHLYLCPECLSDSNMDGGFEHKLAALQPKGPQTTSLYCPVCDKSHSVTRKDCVDPECLGNVVTSDGNQCLTCAAWQPYDEV